MFKEMKKAWLLRLLMGTLIITLILTVAIGSIFAGDPIVIRYAHGDPPDPIKSSAHADAVVFKRLVESRSAGKIKVEIYPACELGSEREMLEGVQLGSIQVTNVSEGTVGIFFPEILCTAIPFAFSTYTEAWRTLDSPFVKTLMEEMRKKTGIRALHINQNGFRHFSNNIRPIRTPADLKGLKLRTMEHRGHMKMVESLGANPVPIAWGELYTALQQGVVDGQENPPSLVLVMKFNEVQKYYTLDGHIYSIDFTFINDAFYKDLPDELKQIVYDAGQISGWFHRGAETYTSECIAVKELINAGMEVYVPTAEEIELFRQKAQKPVIEWIKTEIDPRWVDGFLEAIDEAKLASKAPGIK